MKQGVNRETTPKWISYDTAWPPYRNGSLSP